MAFQQRFEIVSAPRNDDESAQLSISVTQRFGSKGWEVVAVTPAGTTLILVLQKPL